MRPDQIDPFSQADNAAAMSDAVAAAGGGWEFLAETGECHHFHTTPDRLMIARQARIETVNALKRRRALDLIPGLPEPGVSYHIVTNARFDLWDWVPVLLDRAEPRKCLEFYGSSWIYNRRSVVELLELHDTGRIDTIGLITGQYFRKRTPGIFNLLYEGLLKRGQRLRACMNHSKWFAMRFDDESAIVLESSANYTENGNIEQHVLTSDRTLFDFYKTWSGELLADEMEGLA
jgi:hypothetical protein